MIHKSSACAAGHYLDTRISGRYAPLILAPAEGLPSRAQGLAALASQIMHVRARYARFPSDTNKALLACFSQYTQKGLLKLIHHTVQMLWIM